MLFAGHVSTCSFLHHGLQRHVMLSRNAAAVFILWRVIGNCAIHARDLDPNLTPFGAYAFPTPRQRLTCLVAPSDAQSSGLREYQLSQFVGVLRFAEHR